MLRYNFDNRRPMKLATGRSKKQQNNKNKNTEEEVASSEINNKSVNTEEFEDEEEIIRQAKLEKQRKTPKTWKDEWQRPLNDGIILEDSYSSDETSEHKIRTDTGSKRRESKKSSYVADMINYE